MFLWTELVKEFDKDHEASLSFVAMAQKYEKTEAAHISLNLLCINKQ